MLSYKNNDVDRHRINTFQYSRFSINFPSLDNSSSQLTRERILKIFYSTIIELIQKKKKKKIHLRFVIFTILIKNQYPSFDLLDPKFKMSQLK